MTCPRGLFSQTKTYLLYKRAPTPQKPPKTSGKASKSQKNTKRAHAVTRTTPEISQAPVPSRPGIKYPVRGNPSLRLDLVFELYFLFCFVDPQILDLGTQILKLDVQDLDIQILDLDAQFLDLDVQILDLDIQIMILGVKIQDLDVQIRI